MNTKLASDVLCHKYQVSIYRASAESCWTLQYFDPQRRRRRWKRLRADNEKQAAVLAADFIRSVDSGDLSGRITWDAFCVHYEAARVNQTGSRNRESWATVKRWIAERWPCRVRWLEDVADEDMIRRWQVKLLRTPAVRGGGRYLSRTTVGRYSSYLKWALKWAWQKGMVPQLPDVEVYGTRSRGGAVALADVEKLCTEADGRRKDACYIKGFIRGLFWSGLRLADLHQLSWDREAKFRLDAGGVNGMPVIWIVASAQKSRRDECRFILREFWDLCMESTARVGPVFPLPNGRGGRLTLKRIGKIISDLGRATKIVTDPETGKCITAHDLRKGTSQVLYQKGYNVDEIALYLGHSTPQVTRTHYPPATAATIAARDWEKER